MYKKEICSRTKIYFVKSIPSRICQCQKCQEKNWIKITNNGKSKRQQNRLPSRLASSQSRKTKKLLNETEMCKPEHSITTKQSACWSKIEIRSLCVISGLLPAFCCAFIAFMEDGKEGGWTHHPCGFRLGAGLREPG